MRVSLIGERLQVKTAKGTDISLQAGLLMHRKADGQYYQNEFPETYLVAFIDGRPSIIDRFVGFKPSYEVRDLNSDGSRELFFYFHTGAHQYVLKIFKINEGSVVVERLTPIMPMLYSDMGSIKCVGSDILTKNQEPLSDGSGAIITTDRYRFDGTALKLIDTQREKVAAPAPDHAKGKKP